MRINTRTRGKAMPFHQHLEQAGIAGVLTLCFGYLFRNLPAVVIAWVQTKHNGKKPNGIRKECLDRFGRGEEAFTEIKTTLKFIVTKIDDHHLETIQKLALQDTDIAVLKERTKRLR